MTKKKKRSALGAYNKRDILFYIGLMAFPVLQFVIFYIVVNFNSILLIFQDYDLVTNTTTFVGFDNIKEAFRLMTSTSEFTSSAGYSFLAYILGLVIGMPLALLFSYYIYKKMPASGFFRVLLFMPSIISAIVMVTIFQFFVERALPEIFTQWFKVKSFKGLLENPSTRFATIMFYNIWVSFGVNILIYSDAMGKIPPEVIDAAKLDGATGIKEFWYITLPLVYPTLSTFIVVGVSGILTNQLNLYSFFGDASTIHTYGYWLYVKTASAASKAEYPVIAAVGVLLTIVAVPMTLGVKKLLEKFGPKED